MLSFHPTLLLQLFAFSLSIRHTFATIPAQHLLKHHNLPGHPVTFTKQVRRPTPTNHLSFSSFTYFNASAASDAHLISPGDSNCALSEPNALFAWRNQNPSLWPRFALNATHAADNGLSPYFDLSGLAVECMNNTPLYNRITVQAWGFEFSDLSAPVARQRHLLIWTNTRAGTQFQYPIDCAELFPGWGIGVNMVEMWATTAEGEDWPFCVDDARVVFHEEDGDEARLAVVTGSWEKVEMREMGFELWAERLW